MQNVFFNNEVPDAEKKISSSLNIPTLTLMENAGVNSAEFILQNCQSCLKNEIIIVAGKGNNAGDGFVIARQLGLANIKVKIVMLFDSDELKGDALTNFNILKNGKSPNIKLIYCEDAGSVRKEISEVNKLIVDAIFGIGFKGEPDERIKKVIEYINELKDRTVISIDVPSCLYNYDQKSVCVNAVVTLTMGVKKFHTLFYKGKEASGSVEVIDILLPEDEFTKYNERNIFQTEFEDVKSILPHRKITSNKYSNGKVFILSGSKGLTGAAYLCSQSALRAGAGAVVTGFPESVSAIMEVKLTEVMKLSLRETHEHTLSLASYGHISERLEWADSVLIGPGITKNEETLELVRRIVKENDLNFVIDADAISAFKGDLSILRNKKMILTPHFGEFANLMEMTTEEMKSNFYEIARSFAEKYKVILVLKNSPTVIVSESHFYINSTGRENLATAGTGDVLSGIIAAVFSQTKKPLESAIAGVYIHGKCGDNLYDKFGPDSMIAGDLIDEIPNVKTELR